MGLFSTWDHLGLDDLNRSHLLTKSHDQRIMVTPLMIFSMIVFSFLCALNPTMASIQIGVEPLATNDIRGGVMFTS